MVPISLLTTLLFASAIAAKPVVERNPRVKLAFRKYTNPRAAGSDFNIVENDRRRINSHKDKALGITRRQSGNGTSSIPVLNEAFSYIAAIGVGSPPTIYSVMVDSGSSNLWVGANTSHPYVPTSTSTKTSDSVFVQYGSGNITGTEVIDQVSFGQGLVIANQSMGAASKTFGFPQFDGIIGIGPVGLTVDTLSPDTKATIPTVTDNLFAAGAITENQVSVSFEPITGTNPELNGEVTWGGIDSSKFIGKITFTPVTNVAPASHFWGIDATLSYGSTVLLNSTGIVDTGTSLVLMKPDAFSAYKNATGATIDSPSGFLKITPDQFAKLQSIFITVSGTQFEWVPNAQIWPRRLNSIVNPDAAADDIFLVVGDLGFVGNSTGPNIDLILGQAFLERFYSVYDTTNRQVGLATTSFTNATTN